MIWEVRLSEMEAREHYKKQIQSKTINLRYNHTFYIYCDMCHQLSRMAAFNMNLITVLNINQSAYEPKKLTQRRSMVRWQKNITSQTAKKIMKLSSLSDTGATTVF